VPMSANKYAPLCHLAAEPNPRNSAKDQRPLIAAQWSLVGTQPAGDNFEVPHVIARHVAVLGIGLEVTIRPQRNWLPFTIVEHGHSANLPDFVKSAWDITRIDHVAHNPIVPKEYVCALGQAHSYRTNHHLQTIKSLDQPHVNHSPESKFDCWHHHSQHGHTMPTQATHPTLQGAIELSDRIDVEVSLTCIDAGATPAEILSAATDGIFMKWYAQARAAGATHQEVQEAITPAGAKGGIYLPGYAQARQQGISHADLIENAVQTGLWVDDYIEARANGTSHADILALSAAGISAEDWIDGVNDGIPPSELIEAECVLLELSDHQGGGYRGIATYTQARKDGKTHFDAIGTAGSIATNDVPALINQGPHAVTNSQRL
jgi:hypothetical protein